MVSPCSACGAFVTSNQAEFELNNITIAPRTLARIFQLLTTNEPPQDAELALILPMAHKTAAQLACLDAEIYRLRAQLTQLLRGGTRSLSEVSRSEHHHPFTLEANAFRGLGRNIFLESAAQECLGHCRQSLGFDAR
ncbi:hypothetical protein B0H12DRAFT_1107760 [Mycena haematopus]|nr:hypothetical protein B0H12DRAFT_1107760 [Mycena haematopus]